MCCLYGIMDCRRALTAKQKNQILSALATAAEARGTDATGIAYNDHGKLRIYKRPWPAHSMRFRVPEDARVVMGHTRMTTQGAASRNRNNHPFEGRAGGQRFALAHNGVIWNDDFLRRGLSLPQPNIETDSYIGVQLIQRKNTLDFASLRYMAEQVEGSFTFTVLDTTDNLYFIKGDNPLCIYHYPRLGLYLYASTEEILQKALSHTPLSGRGYDRIPIECGEILRITREGAIRREEFDDSNLLMVHSRYSMYGFGLDGFPVHSTKRTYLDELKSVAAAFGFTPESIDRLMGQGFSPEEIEELFYCGEM